MSRGFQMEPKIYLFGTGLLIFPCIKIHPGLDDDNDRAATDSDSAAIDYENESAYIQSEPEQVESLC